MHYPVVLHDEWTVIFVLFSVAFSFGCLTLLAVTHFGGFNIEAFQFQHSWTIGWVGFEKGH